MQIAKTATLFVALGFGGFALQLFSPERVITADSLQGTTWSNDAYDFDFLEGGKVEVMMGVVEVMKGTYRQDGNSVEMIFEDKSRASGTIQGTKMRVKAVSSNGTVVEFVLTKS